MGAQLSLKAAMPLAEILATCRKHVNNTGPWVTTMTQQSRWSNMGLFTLSLPGQKGRCFAHSISQSILFDVNVRISIRISLKCFPKGPIDSKAALDQVMAWRRTGEKSLPEPMLTQFIRSSLPNNSPLPCFHRPFTQEGGVVVCVILNIVEKTIGKDATK